jgi:uncharacterized membrane protein
MSIIEILSVGLSAGFFIAVLGALKNNRKEGFYFLKFIRSPIIATVWGFIASYAFGNGNWFLYVGFCIGMERLTVEVWKTLFRRPQKESSWGIRRT